MANLDHEKKAQKKWRLLPQYQYMDAGISKMIDNEFLPPKQQLEVQSASLRNLIHYVTRRIPFYIQQFREIGHRADDIKLISDLSLLPVMSREDLQINFDRLHSRVLPQGHRLRGITRTSGSTGQPVKVLNTNINSLMFSILVQRDYRWFQMDPDQTMATIRNVEDLPRGEDGHLLEKNNTCHSSRWLYVGNLFQTGRFIGFSEMNSPDKQLEWLHAHSPSYLTGMSASLEQLAFACQAESVPGSLLGIKAITQQMTPEMRVRMANAFHLPINQNYGLNEIGLVAARCPEGGRYHVHTEHCLVEIVNDDGRPCATGETGHLVVTSLCNAAMPLLRYDTGDLAIQLEGPCPCGRTLPSFGEIKGRYRRLTAVPPGTWDQWRAVQQALDNMPEELSTTLRQYQLHQNRDGSYRLRLAVTSHLDKEFSERILKQWRKVTMGETPELTIDEMDSIPRGNSRKFDSFTSDYFT